MNRFKIFPDDTFTTIFVCGTDNKLCISNTYHYEGR